MKYQGFLAAMPPDYEYNQDAAFEAFFAKTTTSRQACDDVAKAMFGGEVKPVSVQGNCSYTVYAGPNLEHVVQFRLGSLPLHTDVLHLAQEIHGQLVPVPSFHGHVGNTLLYTMLRVEGISYLDFLRSKPDRVVAKELRQAMMKDIAQFFASSWNTPHQMSDSEQSAVRHEYMRDLESLLDSFPPRFHAVIRLCLDNLDAILSLPVVLLHRDFSTANILVDVGPRLLTAVLDWGEAGLGTFGQNLHFLQNLMCVLDPDRGWLPLEDYASLQDTFWLSFVDSIGGLSNDNIKTIKLASIMGLLLYRGFTRRLAGMPPPVPISPDDEEGRYSFLYLDAFILKPGTRILDFD